MALIFNRYEKVIRKHINNVFYDGELDKENNTQKMRVDGVKQFVPKREKRILAKSVQEVLKNSKT